MILRILYINFLNNNEPVIIDINISMKIIIPMQKVSEKLNYFIFFNISNVYLSR